MNLNSDNGHIILALTLLALCILGHYVGFPNADSYAFGVWTFLFSKLDPKSNLKLLGGPPDVVSVPTPSATAGTGDIVKVESHEVPPAAGAVPPIVPPAAPIEVTHTIK